MIGILLSSTKLERPLGDIGHPHTLAFPAIYETVSREKDILPLTRSLMKRGARAIITEHYIDPDSFREFSVPVYTSPLTLLPFLLHTIPGKIAVLTDKEASISPKYLHSFNVSLEAPLLITGMDDMPAFTEAYVTGTRPLDPEAVAFELKFVTQRMKKMNPALSCVLLASPYMTAYRRTIREVADVPVFDLVSLAAFIHESYT